MRRLYVIHHGLENRRSHFYGEGLGWIAACRERGIEFRLYVHRRATPDIIEQLRAHGSFRHRAGTASIARLKGESSADHAVMERWFAEDCAALEAEGVGQDDVIVVTFASEIEVMGMALWLAQMPPEQRPRLAFIFHREPCLNLVMQEDRAGVNADFSDFMAAVAELKSVISPERMSFLATTPHLAGLLRLVAQHPCAQAPHPSIYLAEDVLAAEPEPRVHVRAPGQLRLEKGSAILAEVLLRFAEARPGRALSVQANDQADASEMAQQLSACKSPFSVYYGQLSHAQYQRRVVASDIVLLPYDWRRYPLRGSGVFSEAVGFGVPTVVPDRTWMADNLRAGLGAGTIFEEQSVASILKALLHASDDLTALRERARGTMQQWRRKHSIAALLEAVLRSPAKA